MTHHPEPRACSLCGSETEPTAMSLVEWLEPIDGEIWSHVPRCVDRPACRARVELPKPAGLGEPWPVNDRTPAPVREHQPARVEVAPDVDAEEATAWG